MNNEKVRCPICKGEGCLPAPEMFMKRKELSKQLRTFARELRKEGYTIRTIAAFLGFDHPGSISHLLSKNKTK